jgi:ADP-heptose:LPS heptosyltransferase
MKSPRILIVRIGALGDVFFALPAVTVLRAQYPSAEITWLVGSSLASVLRGHPEIDKIETISEEKIFGRSRLAALLEILKTLIRLRRHYNFIFLLHRDARWTIAFRTLLGPIFQLARPRKNWTDNLVHSVRFPALTMNEGLQVRELLATAIPETRTKAWDVCPAFWKYNSSQDSLKRPYIVLHLGGGQNIKTEFTLKQWPHWHELIQQLILRFSGDIVLVGAKSESEQADQLTAQLNPLQSSIKNLVGKTSLPGLISVISKAVALVGVDSGPLHIADAAGIRTIGIFGPTSDISWGLVGKKSVGITHPVPCAPCYKDDGIFPACNYQHRCMTGLLPQQILDLLDFWP